MGLKAVSKMQMIGLTRQQKNLQKKTGLIGGDFKSPDADVQRLARVNREIGKRIAK